jgi:hypothetical protein
VLRLEFNQLKRAAEASRANDDKRAAPVFVELFAPQTSGIRECVLELEGSRGRLRIELKGVATAEVSGISRALWEMLA